MFKKSILILFGLSIFIGCQQNNELKTSEYADAINKEITGDLAFETTSFVEKYWRVVGNTGFNKSIYRIAEQLEKDGYVLEENATENDRLTYRIEKRPLKRPTWESVDAKVTIVGQDTPLLTHDTNRNMIALRSYSTPKEGVTAEVIHIKDLKKLKSTNLKGKIVFAETHPGRIFKTAVVNGGAVGLITYNNPKYLQPEKNTTSIQFRSIPLDTVKKSWGIAMSYAAKERLKEALSKERKTKNGGVSVDPVFILDQTFCPNVHFLGDEEMLASVRTIAYVSGSKFPSGGKCTAGYAVANKKASGLMDKIEKHLKICDNEATPLQLDILAEQMPSMIQRIADAYENTREFVTFIEAQLPDAKINFVSEELANQTFTPSVFSLDLPTKGNTEEEKEAYKRALNLKLINKMIEEIPNESKFCVSYGQLKGCYWTIPATSTQGTTKEGDKDYIVRVALAPDLDLEKHKQVFKDFVDAL